MRVYRTTPTVSLLTLCLLLSSAALAGPGVTLAYKYIKGKPLQYQFSQDQSVEIKGMPMAPGGGGAPGMSADGVMKVSMKSVGVLRYDTIDVAKNGDAQVSIRFTEFTTTTSIPGSPVGQMDDLIKQTSFSMQTEPSGKVKDFKLIGINDPMMSSNDFVQSIKNTLTQTQPQFPARPLAIGETWSSAVNAELPMAGFGMNATLATTATYTLKKVDTWQGKKAAYCEVKNTVKITSPLDPGTGKPIMTGEGSFNGTMIFLVDDGVMAEMEVKGVQNLVLAMPQGMGPGMATPGAQQPQMQQSIALGTSMRLIPNPSK